MSTAANAEDRCPECGGSLSKVWVDGKLVREYCPVCTPELDRRELLGRIVDETKRRILEIPDELIESLARAIHDVYQIEAKRQDDVRHPDDYGDLPESVKDYDRALAKWLCENFDVDELTWARRLRGLELGRDSSPTDEKDRERRRESDESRPRGRFSELVIPPEKER